MTDADLRLVVVSSGAQHGSALPLRGAEQTIGRADGSDLQLNDPSVSRHHAVVRRVGSAVLIEDTGSMAGVAVNGTPIRGPALLSLGDVISIGRTDLEVTAAGQTSRRLGAAPTFSPAVTPQQRSAPHAGAHFDVGSQEGAWISNVGRDQYNYNSIALRLAPLRRRALLLIRLGVVCILGGTAVGAYVWVRMGAQIVSLNEWIFGTVQQQSSPDLSQAPTLSFDAFAWVPVMVVLWLAGITLVAAGLLTRRRVRKEQERR